MKEYWVIVCSNGHNISKMRIKKSEGDVIRASDLIPLRMCPIKPEDGKRIKCKCGSIWTKDRTITEETWRSLE